MGFQWGRRKSACILWVLSALFVGNSRESLAQLHFPLHTSGTAIVDAKGVQVTLHAASWYGAESSDYVVGGLQTATLESIVQQFHSYGLNAVRLPWSNALYEQNPVVRDELVAANPHLRGKHALEILDRVVQAFGEAHIMVILDNHNSDAEWCCGKDGNALWYNQRYPESAWLNDWKGMVRRYHTNPWVIGVDLRNEPREEATWGGKPETDWHLAAERGGNAVLSTNPHLLVFVEGINYALDYSGIKALPLHLNKPKQLVYSVHDYGFDYQNLTSYEDFKARIEAHWGMLLKGENAHPVWVGEFGTCNASESCITSTKAEE